MNEQGNFYQDNEIENQSEGIELTEEQQFLVQIISKYLAGWTVEEIAATTPFSPATIRRRLLDNEVEMRRKGRRWPDVPEEEVAQRYQQGESMDEIGKDKDYDISASTVKKILKKHQIKIRQGGRGNLSELPEEEVARLYREGATTPDLSIKYKVSSSKIRATLKRQKVKMREPGPKRKPKENS